MQQQRPGVVRYLALKPYGNSLLSPAGAFWIFAVRIAILLMASAEALSWSYAAFYLATGGLRWAAGLGAFVFTFLTVCLIDASLMTLDRWARRHDHRITLETPPKWWERGRDLFSIGTRVGLVALSMYVTAPFLTQLMFNDDIGRALADERTAIRVKTREALLEPISKRSATLQSQMDDRRAALDAEVAGAGVSGRYGDGVAARQIRASIATLEQEKAAVDAEHKRLSSEFDALNDEQMAERYNVALPGESFQERARALVTIRNDSYRLTERAVQSFLAFLFASLVLLKLFEPRSVQVYFSERLQGLYRQYRGGSFDAHIEPAERSVGGAPMSPLRFEDWCLNTYPAVRQRDLNAVTAGERIQFFANSESELTSITASATAEENKLIEELATLESQLLQAATELAASRRLLDGADGQLADIKSQRTTLEAGLKRPGSPTTLATIVNSLSELESSGATLAAQKTTAHERVDALTPLVTSLEGRRADLSARLQKISETRKQCEGQLAEARLRHMAEINRLMSARTAGDAPATARFDSDPEPPKHVM
jgi:hypothetical protein